MILLISVIFAAFMMQTPTGQPAGQTSTFGPFTAVQINGEVVKDVTAQGNDIYVKVGQKYWPSDFKMKISNAKSESYRRWGNGEEEMAVKVHQSRAKNICGYTHRVSTGAKFIGYFTRGRFVLLLERSR